MTLSASSATPWRNEALQLSNALRTTQSVRPGEYERADSAGWLRICVCARLDGCGCACGARDLHAVLFVGQPERVLPFRRSVE